MEFDAITYFPSALQAAPFDSSQFTPWPEEAEGCCLSCPVTDILPLWVEKRLESSAEKVSQEGSGKSYITHGSSSMRG